jgi:hypothetical protein
MGSFISSMASVDFVRKYGKYALAYPLLYMDGTPNFYVSYPMVFFILCLIGGILILHFTYNIKVDANGNKILDEQGKPVRDYENLTPLQSGMKKFSYGLFISSVLFILLYAINYWFRYIPQYYKWLDELPTEGKVQIGIITTLKNMSGSKR